jgi:hypothetical protein
VLVNAMLYFNGRAIPVYGACTIRQGPNDAAARASLDAINRFLDLTLPEVSVEGFDELERFDYVDGRSFSPE